MIRILAFSTNYLPHIGGAELALKHITDRLDDEHYTIHLVAARLTRERAQRERVGNVMVHRVGIGLGIDKFLLPLVGPFMARRLHREQPFEIAWSMMASQGGIAAGLFATFGAAPPLIVTLQEGNDEARLKRYVLGSDLLYRLLIQPLYMLVFKRARAATVISTYLKKRFRQYNETAPVTLIPNGVDLDRFARPEAIDPFQEKRTLTGRDDSVLLITSSRLVPKNAVDVCIESLAHLGERYHLLILGDGPLRDELAAKAVSHRVRNRVHFHGSVAPEAVPRYLYMSDIFVRPSQSEGMGSSFLEAMAAGLPVVATSVGGISDFLRHRENGMVVPVGDPQVTAETCRLLADDTQLYDSLATAARQMVHERYSWDTIANEYEEVFERYRTPTRINSR